MPSKILSATNLGLDSHLIQVEADILCANPNFLIVGLPDTAVQEAKERVRSAIKNSDLVFPRTKVTVNLAPADLKKIGPSFDLPIAVAVMEAKRLLKISKEDRQAVYLGELSLDGDLRPINGVLNIASNLKNWGLTKIYLPEENCLEATIIGGLEIYPVKNLRQLYEHLKGKKLIKQFDKKIKPIEETALTTDSFSQIKGQEHAKRALIIAASGCHNLLMVGPPGSGKTLLARSLPELMPPLSLAESLEVTKIYSLSGLLAPKQPLIINRPFRAPHHTSSGIALIGGGSFPRPGEITLAHRGALFLDELPEFPRAVLENLRQPIEDGLVTISRALTTVQFPSSFILVAAANPCPCGFATDETTECRCKPAEIQRYQKKISGPILDRIDLQVPVPRLKTDELINVPATCDLTQIKQTILRAQQIQKERFANLKILYNSEMGHHLVEKICELDAESTKLLKAALTTLGLSARSYHKVLKVARTIADLEASEKIQEAHLAESLQYRQTLFNLD